MDANRNRYFANFSADEIDGKVYAIGEEIKSIDPGTAAFLVRTGRITETAAGDDPVTALGGEGGPIPAADSLKHVADMHRIELLTELASGQSDDALRDAVESKRRYEASDAEDRAAELRRQDEANKADTFDADAFIARNLDDISDDEIKALSAEDRAAVIAAEKDREKPRTTLLGRLGEPATA